MSDSIEASQGLAVKVKRRSPLKEFVVRLIKEKPLGTIGGVIVLIMLFAGIFAEFIAPFGMNESHLVDRLSPPGAPYILGTDNLGRDMFSRIVFGARISMIVGLGATTIATAISTILGIVSGFIGGKFDLIVQRFVDAWICFPALVLILIVMSLVGGGLLQVIVVIGLQLGIGGSRIIRGATIGIKENVYVEASRAVGCSTGRMLIRHILPNIMAPVVILYSSRVANIILMEASLSFLGFGVPPPAPSWGGMLSGVGREYIYLAPWMAIWSGVALTIAVYGINMLGDAIRDLLDPRLRGGVGRYGGVKLKKEVL